jgi:carbamoyltransferase
MTYILGISAYYHDSAAALIKDGEIVAAAQEERFTRKKGDASFPHEAVGYCLDYARIEETQLDHVVFYENPLAKFDRLLTTYHLTAPKSFRSYITALPQWLTRNLWLGSEVRREIGFDRDVIYCDHHLSHAASAFFPSPYEEAAILTIDGVGEWSTTTFGVGKGNKVDLYKEIRFPNSIGLLYSAFTYFCGFRINSGEYKLMGLAPYGKPIYEDIIRDKIIRVGADGAIVLNQKYFDYLGGLTMTNNRFSELFGGPPRQPETELTQREMDIAASLQKIVNEIVLDMARAVADETGMKNLVLAGGVALNVVASGILASSNIFDEIWIQPAAGDAGGALGAALWQWHDVLNNERVVNPIDSLKGSFLGPNIEKNNKDDSKQLKENGATWTYFENDEELQNRIATHLANGEVVGLARGRMEWGPRALGNRSILGDAGNTDMQTHMNLKIKFRESFRPFAPMVLEEEAHDWFKMPQNNPYMLFAFPVQEHRRLDPQESSDSLWGIDLLKVPRSQIPAVTHVDYSARAQTIDKNRNPFVHGVISNFHFQTGRPVIVNTSFNVRGEPIVSNAIEAYKCFMATNMDVLVVGNRLLIKDEQENRPMSETERQSWLGGFDLD